MCVCVRASERCTRLIWWLICAFPHFPRRALLEWCHRSAFCGLCNNVQCVADINKPLANSPTNAHTDTHTPCPVAITNKVKMTQQEVFVCSNSTVLSWNPATGSGWCRRACMLLSVCVCSKLQLPHALQPRDVLVRCAPGANCRQVGLEKNTLLL